MSSRPFTVGDLVAWERDGRAVHGRVVAADAERFGVRIDGMDPIEIFCQDTPAVILLEQSKRRR